MFVVLKTKTSILQLYRSEVKKEVKDCAQHQVNNLQYKTLVIGEQFRNPKHELPHQPLWSYNNFETIKEK